MPTNLKDFLYGIDEQLKGGQSLLTVDDDSPLYRPGRELELLNHHRTHEVRLGTIFVHDRLSEACYIVRVFRRICGQNGGLVVPRQTHSVRVCSPAPAAWG